MKPFLVLFEPEIPYNVGSIIRLCACFKTKLVIIRPCGFIWDIKKLKRSVMDYYDKCEIVFFNEFKEFKKQHKGRILSTSSKNGTMYSELKYEKNDAILMGKESLGLPEEVFNQTDIKLNIPIFERSLNLSLSSAILLSNAISNY
ncbi:TrmH family RNA methyltransferase [Alphaproteobacteria bacterium endosymbiont of Tiliacea citrago]|uniref:TrmH family RNA methyltransferase n=1 Tax=Alphaproteobacteria bacterium endosymbiont of Tiliacea citrago TaxID=3077944 RepID=UPI00313DFD76